MSTTQWTNATPKHIRLGGRVGELLDNICRNWLLSIRETNPSILGMLKYPDKKPYRFVEPWGGEFAGKYLTGAAQIYSYSDDEALGAYLKDFVEELLACQQPNGYLGPFPHDYQLKGKTADVVYCFQKDSGIKGMITWDCWSHYHAMMGLLCWWNKTGEERALEGACRIANLFCATFFGEGQPRLMDTGSREMNMAPLHAFTCLYKITGKEAYLRFAEEVIKDLGEPGSADFLNQALAGKEFYQMPLPRWEGLHIVQGLAGLYDITDDDKYKKAVEHLWWSMTGTDLHNTGGFTTCEQALGTPFREGAIETCCTIAYMALTQEMIRLTGNSVCADVMEWCTLNSAIAAFSPSGRWSTYDTPMRGYKRANYHSIVFQSRPGSPDLNCCSVNAHRALGMLNEWAYAREGDTLTINYYGENEATVGTGADAVCIRQETTYPDEGHIRLHLSGPGLTGKVRLRIPFWSTNTTVRRDDGPTQVATPGTYYVLEGDWAEENTVDLMLDMSLRFVVGEETVDGLTSVFYGPLVLCLDPWYNLNVDFENPPRLDAVTLEGVGVRRQQSYEWLLDVRAADGTTVTLCDLYTAGVYGTPYTTWLPIDRAPKAVFSQDNPSRTARPV